MIQFSIVNWIVVLSTWITPAWSRLSPHSVFFYKLNEFVNSLHTTSSSSSLLLLSFYLCVQSVWILFVCVWYSAYTCVYLWKYSNRISIDLKKLFFKNMFWYNNRKLDYSSNNTWIKRTIVWFRWSGPNRATDRLPCYIQTNNRTVWSNYTFCYRLNLKI